MTVTTISLKKESIDIIEEIRKRNPDFNLSGFINDKIKETLGKDEVILSKDYLIKEISIINSEIRTYFKKIELYESKIIDLGIKEELEKKEIELRQIKAEEKLNYQKKMTNNFFKDVTGRDMTDEEFSDYKEKFDKNEVDSIFQYIKIKGIKEIPIEVEVKE